MKSEDFLRIDDKYLIIENIISEGGYGFIYKASEIAEKDFIMMKGRSTSPVKNTEKKESKGLYNRFIKGFKRGKKKAKQKLDLKYKGKGIKRGKQFALKKIITQNSER